MSDYNKILLELIENITKYIDLPAFIKVNSQEAKILFGDKECYNTSDNYMYFDKNNKYFKIICTKTDEEIKVDF